MDELYRLDDRDHPAVGMGEAARLLGVTPAFLRSLDTADLLTPARSEGGHRRYTRNQLEWIAALRAMTDDGHSLASAAEILALRGSLAGERDRHADTRRDRDRARKERDTARAERDTARAERDSARRERDDALAAGGPTSDATSPEVTAMLTLTTAAVGAIRALRPTGAPLVRVRAVGAGTPSPVTLEAHAERTERDTAASRDGVTVLVDRDLAVATRSRTLDVVPANDDRPRFVLVEDDAGPASG